MSKRLADESGQGGPPRKKVIMEPSQIGPISNLEELEVKTLQFQNQKLGMRLNQRIQLEEELRQRIDQLEKRQTQDDAVINVIHRYWNQLNEDIRILLQRFDAETGDESEKDNEHESTKSFLAQLATWHKQELDEKLANRVQVSQRAVAKIIQVFDHMIQRNDKIFLSIHQAPVVENNTEENGEDKDNADKEDDATNETKPKEPEKEEKEVEKPNVSLDAVVKEVNIQLQRENKALHHLNTSLHEKNHFLSLKDAEAEERIFAETTKNEELQNKLDDLEYELTKCRMKNQKLESSLLETRVCSS